MGKNRAASDPGRNILTGKKTLKLKDLEGAELPLAGPASEVSDGELDTEGWTKED